MQKAFRLLALRSRSEKELRAGLRKKGFEEHVVDAVIGRLHEMDYLNDASFARGWVRTLAINRLYGNRLIETSLGEKGIPGSVAKQMLAEIREEFPEAKAIRKLIEKKIGHRQIAYLDERQKRSLWQSLAGKGFAPGLIFEAFKQFEEGFTGNDGE
jgi:regulatory protein